MSDTDAVTAEVRALEQMGLEALRAEWRRRWGEPPKLRSVNLLRRYMAWHIQASMLGPLCPELRQKLSRQPVAKSTTRRTPLMRPGTRLAREWKGVRHEVEVVEGGFRYGGKMHKSLSAVATAIAGSRWNGPRFFGLRATEGM